jgi:hypothetical protein
VKMADGSEVTSPGYVQVKLRIQRSIIACCSGSWTLHQGSMWSLGPPDQKRMVCGLIMAGKKGQYSDVLISSYAILPYAYGPAPTQRYQTAVILCSRVTSCQLHKLSNSWHQVSSSDQRSQS